VRTRYVLVVPSAYERLGGDAALRAIVEDFYDRVFADAMIGFLFNGTDRARLVQKEWELAAAMLGADVRYTGRPMRQAHARSPILGGHFARRQQILRETLADHHVPDDVAAEWLRHNDRLRPQVTADASSECSHTAAEQRLAREARRLPIAGAAASSTPAPAPERKLLKLGRRIR
jgi:hemoglobin